MDFKVQMGNSARVGGVLFAEPPPRSTEDRPLFIMEFDIILSFENNFKKKVIEISSINVAYLYELCEKERGYCLKTPPFHSQKICKFLKGNHYFEL